MIAPEAGLSVSRQCALLGVARSSFYYRLSAGIVREELELLKRLDRIFTHHPVYGSRRLQVALFAGGGFGWPPTRPAADAQASGYGRSGRSGTPASGIPSTRSIRIFCAAERSTSRTKCGPLI